MTNKTQNQPARGTPIFDDRDKNNPQKPDTNGDTKNRAAPKPPKGDAQEIAREQGSGKDTPQRDHGRERGSAKPAGTSAPAADIDSPNIRPGTLSGHAQSNEDLPDDAAGVRKNSSNIDDAHKAR